MQIGLFKKEKQKEFSEMTKPEKNNFLACDLIERMIRIEQKVRGSMGDGIVPYYKTEYFMGLNLREKNKFVKHLDKKAKKAKWKFLPFAILASFGLVVSVQMTGNVVGASSEKIPLINYALLFAFIIVIASYGIYAISKNKKSKRFDRHFRVIEDIISGRKSRKK